VNSIAAKVQTTWDAGAAHVARNPRKYTAIGFVGAFVRDWFPWLKDGWTWGRSQLPEAPVTVMLEYLPYFVGFGFIALVWWETRKRQRGSAHQALRNDEAGLRDSTTKEDGRQDLERVKEQALAYSQHQEEQLVALANRLQAMTIERDGANQALATCKRAFAQARIRWFADRVRMNIEKRRQIETRPDVRVTVRFAAYDDYPLAQQIEAILREHTGWPITLDNRNDPVLRPSDEFKVIFGSAMHGTFGEVASAFSDGQLLSCHVGMRDDANRFDQEHLIVEVLPTLVKP